MLPLIQENAFYPGQWGIQGSDDPLGLRLQPGAQVYYVQSGHPSASNSNDGTDPNFPRATLASAIGLPTAGRGDLILIGAGHSENVAVAGGITAALAGVTVLGLGDGQQRPRFSLTDAAASVIVSASDVTFENLVFLVGADSITIMLDVNADDFTLKNCEFRENTAVAQQWLTAVDINGGGAHATDRAKVLGCKFVSEAAGANHAIEIAAVQDGIEIRNCWISGDFAVAGIHSTAALTNLLLENNYVRNVNAGDFAIELTAAATGMAVGNRLYADAYLTTFDSGNLMCLDNLAVNAFDMSASPIPFTPALNMAETCVVKLDGAVLNGADNLFDVTGGPILVTEIFGICTVNIGGAANMTLQHTSTSPGGAIALSTTVAIGALVAGGSISFTDVALPVLTPTAAGTVINPGDANFFLPIGTLQALGSAAQAGNIEWYLRYKPLSAYAQVAPSA